MVLLNKACHLSLLQVPPRYYTLSLDLSYTDRQWLWGWQCRPRLKHPVQTRSQRPPSLIPTSSPCSPDTGIATWCVLGRRGTKIRIPASFAKLSVCHLGNTDFVGADHTDRGINAVPSVRHGTALRRREDAPTQGVTFDEVVRSLPPTRDLRRSREPSL